VSLADLWSTIVVKLPLILLILAVWWAMHEEPEGGQESAGDDDGGLRRPLRCERPGPPHPRSPRRGPHGGARPPAPPRARPVRARARSCRT
jgi:hypothetical protein